jgi:hypothetical protein
VALYVKAGKLTGRVLAKALQAALRRLRNPKAKAGKQSVKSLTRQGASLQSMEITDSNIKAFERSARKFGVDFALKRDAAAEPPRYLVFFKAKDADALTAAFQDFIGRTLGKKNEKKRPSLLGQLAKFKELAKNAPAKEKHQNRGGHEL